jgi:O-antigen ligase
MNHAERSDSSAVIENRARPWASILFLLAVIAATEADALICAVRSGGPTEELKLLEEGNPVTRISKLCFGAYGAAWLSTARRRRFGVHGVFGLLLLAFIALIFASVLWADDKSVVLKRVSVLAMMLLAALAVAEQFSLRDMIRLGFWCGIICLGFGLVAEVILHKFAPLTADYRFGGTIHPNAQGWNCGALCLCALCLTADGRRARRLLYGVAVVALGFLVLTGSRTALGSTVAALLVLGALRIPPLRLVSLGLVAATGLAVVFLLVDESKIVQAVLLNRPAEDEESSISTLTGRTLLWRQFGSQVADRPLLGYGYGGFWTPARIMEIADAEGWVITHPHSSYLDLALDLGILGAVAFVSVILLGIRGYLRRYRHYGDIGDAFAVALLVALATNMLLESRFRFSDSAIFVFLSLALLLRLGFLCESPLADGDRVETAAAPPDGLPHTGMAPGVLEEPT